MRQANEFYQNKNFSEAINNYDAILKQGLVSPELYYNLGNAYFRNGELGKAILYYEKTLKLSPNDDDANYNLLIAKARTVDNIKEVPRLFIFNWWETILTAFSTSGWLLMIFVFYILFLSSASIYFFLKRIHVQKFAFIFGLVNLFVMIITIILFTASLNRETADNYGILIKSVETAKISPGMNSNDAFVIHEGIKFEIEDELDNWAKIKLTDGKVGWLPKNSFENI
jgi:tetratricopeptide (TPR) repeat protein